MSELTVDRVRAIMEGLAPGHTESLGGLEEMYDPDVRFQDPIQTLHGRDAVVAMNEKILTRARELRFEVRDGVRSGDLLFLTWKMTFALVRGPSMEFDGATRLRIRGELVVEHQDYFDLVGGLVDSVPVVGKIYHRVARAFA